LLSLSKRTVYFYPKGSWLYKYNLKIISLDALVADFICPVWWAAISGFTEKEAYLKYSVLNQFNLIPLYYLTMICNGLLAQFNIFLRGKATIGTTSN
jgi:hypothetical protein